MLCSRLLVERLLTDARSAVPSSPGQRSSFTATLPCLRATMSTPCSYFLQPKAAIMSHLEEAVKGSDGELKKLNSSRCVGWAGTGKGALLSVLQKQ